METKKLRDTSFRCAYDRVPHGKIRELRKKLKEAIGIKTDAGINYKINGTNQVKLWEAWKIEAVFKEYGIEVEWGCKEKENK